MTKTSAPSSQAWIASRLRVLEDVVAEADDELLAAREVARHADHLRDPAGLDLHLVGQVEVEQHLVGRRAHARGRRPSRSMKSPACCLPGDEQHLAHADPLQQLERVVDHRPAADRQQVLVRDARQLLEPRRRPACADQSLHEPEAIVRQRARAGRGWCSSGDGGTRTSRASARGSHQFQRPRTAISAGHEHAADDRRVDEDRDREPERRTPAARRCCPATKPENAAHMITAAAVMIRPGPLEPVRDRRLVVVALVPRLAHARDEEHLVVHREPEEHREQEDRDPALDLGELVEARAGSGRRPKRKTTTSIP